MHNEIANIEKNSYAHFLSHSTAAEFIYDVATVNDHYVIAKCFFRSLKIHSTFMNMYDQY